MMFYSLIKTYYTIYYPIFMVRLLVRLKQIREELGTVRIALELMSRIVQVRPVLN